MSFVNNPHRPRRGATSSQPPHELMSLDAIAGWSIQPMRVTMHFRLQTATDCRLTVPDASGNQGELNSCTKLCFAAAPRHSRIPRFVSTAAAQQQMATSNKNAKTKKEPSAGQLA